MKNGSLKTSSTNAPAAEENNTWFGSQDMDLKATAGYPDARSHKQKLSTAG